MNYKSTKGPDKSFEKALVDAVPFLRALPRAGGFEKDVLAQLAAFRAAHAEVGVDLVIDRQPGHPDVDFDLLLQGDAAGTVAIGWRPDGTMPWSVQYSEHWASSLLVSVNGRDLTIQEALQALRLNGDARADLSTGLVDYCLIAAAITNDPPFVSDSELQGEADRFRSTRGLYNAETTDRWLAEAGLSTERFEALLMARVQARKLRERIAEAQVEAYFANHADSLAMVTVIRVHSASEDSLRELTACDGAISNLVDRALAYPSNEADPRFKVCIETGLVVTVLPSFPADSMAAPDLSILGPIGHRGDYWCAQVLRRMPARLNQETCRYIQKRIFASWLEAERAKAQISWHWM